MKNVIILYHPPFRNNIFPFHIIKNLKAYRFFIFLVDDDYESHKKYVELNYVENIVSVKFEIKNLIEACNAVKNKHGAISSILYLAEECVQLCGALRQHYNLSTDNLDKFVDKKLMLNVLTKFNVRTPRSMTFDNIAYQNNHDKYLLNIERKLGAYPFFIKPSNLCGSVGTSIIYNQDELIKWAKQKLKHNYLIQEYIDGTLFHCESFVKENEILHFSVFEYSNPGFFFSQGFSVGSLSLPAKNEIAERVGSFNQRVLHALKMTANGVYHLEFFLNKNNELIFLEAAARPPGLAGELLYQKHLNLSITEAHLLLQLDICDYDFSKLKIDNYAVRYIFPFPSSGQVRKYENKIPLNSAFIEMFKVNVGDKVKKSKDLFNVAGTMVLWNKNYDELRQDFLALKDFKPLEIE